MDNFAVTLLGLTSVSGQQRKAYKNGIVIYNLNCSICLEVLLHDLSREKRANIWDVPNCVSLANLHPSQQPMANETGRRTIFIFSPRKKQGLRDTQAHCLKNRSAQTELDFLWSAEAKSSNSTDTALAKTPSVSSPQACHSRVSEQHQRVIGCPGSPVRLTLSQV